MIKQSDSLKETTARDFFKSEVLKYGSIPPDVMQKFIDDFEFVQYNKHHKIIREEAVSEHIYFITRGIVMVYYRNDGNMIIDWFGEEGTFFGNLYDFITRKPSSDIYESIEEVEGLRIKYDDLFKWFRESHEIENTALKILEQHYVKYIERVHNIKSLQAEEKYRLFMKYCSGFINRLPLKYIANYLNITPETLSRVRSNFDMKE